MIGQIVYNLEDYAGSGGLVSTDKDDLYKTVNSLDNEDYYDRQVEIEETNAFAGYGLTNVTKLGIQAPPGTKFYFQKLDKDGNETSMKQEIMVGRTGIYELEEGINIDYLSFKPREAYVLDKVSSDLYMNTGREAMLQAKLTLDKWYNEHKPQDNTPVGSEAMKNFLEQYEEAHERYVEDYERGRSDYIKGLTGIYMADGTRQLRNVIIDFIYTTVTEEAN